MRLRVIHSCPIWLQQTQTWIYEQVRNLPTDRIEPHVVCRRSENLDQFKVPNLHVFPGRRSWRHWWERVPRTLELGLYSPFLVSTAKRLGARIVHSHFGNDGWSDLQSVRRTRARHVVTFYGYDVNQLPSVEPVWRERYSELFADVDRVLCEGPFMASAIANLGCPDEKIRVHHLGVAVDRIRFIPRNRAPGTPLRVLIAASFTEKKGIPDALGALAKLKDEISLEITIIGDARPNPAMQKEKQRILDTIESGGLASAVRLLGYQPHAKLFDEAYRHHIFLSPSRTASDGDTEGGAPVTIIEMAASGMPIVSTRHCDIPSVVQDGRTGLLAQERNTDELASHLRWLILHPDNWQAMVEAGRHHIEREYDARAQGDRLADIYEELIFS
jgi:colanic acid/amylovoran biosynthesis glycosyltransferase